jgi:cytochrome c
MKKTLIIFTFIAIIASCGSNENKTSENTGANEPAATAAPADPEAEKGLTLVGQSDCFTCHQVVDNSTGPAYQAIAERYKDQPGAIDSLAQKIIKGGAGNWGTVPMTPHPTLSEEDAKTMVKYVLSLKK